jgi:hypothetical protein
MHPAVVLVLFSLAAAGARADGSSDDPQRFESGVLTLTFENDTFAGIDRYYSSGQRVGWQSRGGAPAPLAAAGARLAPWLLPRDGRVEWGVSLDQSLYTPRKRLTRTPPRDDRPYAAQLSATFSLHAADEEGLGVAEIGFGVVGPAALGEEVQELAHVVTGAQEPRGWDRQVSNRPVAVLALERRWRRERRLGEGLALDLVPAAGVELGNLRTAVAAGALLRLGHGLAMDFGPPRMRPALSGLGVFRPPARLAGYLFVGIEGRAVAYDATLDGNHDDYWRVDRQPLVAELPFGLALARRGVRLHATGVLQTRTFDEQSSTPHLFGAVSLSFAF